MNEQETAWSGQFGDDYTKRNRVDWRARIPFWHDIMKYTGARSVYEVGCNAGWNLSAIREASPHKVSIYGSDINGGAVVLARKAGLNVENGPSHEWARFHDLVFSAGVLIHVAPVDLPYMMRNIINASTQWVLAIEYASDVEEEIEYRGERNRLWKRPFGKLYEEMGLRLHHTGVATGFDRCSYWLLERS